MKRILLIDDEPSILKALRRTINILGCELDTFEHPDAALEALHTQDYGLIISDYRMPDMDGVSFLKIAKQRQPDAVRIILSGFTDVSGLMAAINEAEIYRFIPKPWDDLDLIMTIRKTLEYADLLETNRRLLAHIREQQFIIDHQLITLQRLERDNPGITHLERDTDGYILIEQKEN